MAVHKYRVREGFTYGPFGQYKPGAIVELDDGTARFELDKLELAEIVQNVPAADETDLTGNEDAEGPRTGTEAAAAPKVRKSKKSGG